MKGTNNNDDDDGSSAGEEKDDDVDGNERNQHAVNAEEEESIKSYCWANEQYY